MDYRDKDVKAIGELFMKMGEAWNNLDVEAYGNCFTEDADYITFKGQHLKGRKQISDVHQRLFDGLLKGSKLEAKALVDIQPSFVTDDVAIVHRIGKAKLSDANHESGDRGYINTNVVKKEKGKWKFMVFVKDMWNERKM
jgi:uncharacterized protein (TIGR02246 family)